MRYWLIKSEPESWSWDDHVRAQVACWDGVRNHQAAKNMQEMRLGDRAFFYHSVKEKQIVGMVEVVREYYPDSSDASGRFCMVDFRALITAPRPVTLAEIKQDPRLANLPLVRQGRLSVMPIDPGSWKILCDLAGYAHTE